MSKMLASMAAFALVTMLALPGPADAAERRTEGLRTKDPVAQTEFSSQRRYYRRGVVVRRAWGPRWGYRGYWRPRYASGYPYYRPYYAGYWGYPYYRPWYRPYPVVSIGFGFGPRWGWGW
jgi:hypothetical protein